MIFEITELIHNHCRLPPMLQGVWNLSSIYLHTVQWVARRSGGCLIKNVLLFNYLEILNIIVAIFYWVARCECLIYVFLCVVQCHLERYFFLAWIQNDLLITSLFSIFHYKRIRSTQTYLIYMFWYMHMFYQLCNQFISIFWWSSINTYMKLVCIYDIAV